MIDFKKIEAFAREVVEKFDPEKIVLFGSYAEGSATQDSDVDLFILMKHEGRPAEQALAIRRSVRRAFPLDLIVKTPRETEHRLQLGDGFLTSIINTGRTLYERPA